MIFLAKIRTVVRPTPREDALRARFATTRSARASGAPLKVLVQGAQDIYYFGLFGEILTALRRMGAVHAEQSILKQVSVGDGRSVAQYLRLRVIEFLLARKWSRLYGTFCDRVGLRLGGARWPLADMVDLFRARRMWRGLGQRDDLTALAIDGMPVGDLINDTYLRFKPAPNVNIRDRYLWLVIWNAHRLLRRSRHYFGHAQPDVFLTSYSTYVHHGIPARAAIAAGVRVVSFGNYQEFMKELTACDWSHTKSVDGYAAEFRSLPDPLPRLVEAEARITARMAGKLDSTFQYMRQSPYVESSEPVLELRGVVCVFLHDFFDSPHVYRHMLFPDFWEWVEFTINELERSGRPFVLKPHPNQIEMSDDAVARLRAVHPQLRVISSRISNRQLVDAGISCAVTVYGTVAHEMAYLGVPVLACGDHPHVSFEFCRTARTREEYAELLRTFDALPVDRAEARRQSMQFFYMHNLHLTPDLNALREAVAEFRSNCHGAAELGSECAQLLAEVGRQPGFHERVANLASSRPSDLPVLVESPMRQS